MKLITKNIEEFLEKQGNTDNMKPKDILVVAKFFNPVGADTWYIYDRDKEDPDILWCFANLGDPQNAECGTVSLKELEELRLPMGLGIEIDLFFRPGEYTLQEVIDKIKSGGHT